MTSPYPHDPDEHILQMPHKKKRSVVDASYRFESRNPIYRMNAWLLRQVALIVLPIWAKLACQYRVIGRKNLRKVRHQGAVLIINHVYFLDVPIACGCAIRDRKVRYVTLGENMDIPVAGRIIKILGGIPLGSNFSGAKAFQRTVVNLLKRRKLVLFCAESSLWPRYRGIRPFHRGGFVAAVQAGAPVVPMVITFSDGWFGRPKLTMTVGEPISSTGKTAKALCEETHRVFEKIAQDFYGPEYDPDMEPEADSSCG